MDRWIRREQGAVALLLGMTLGMWGGCHRAAAPAKDTPGELPSADHATAEPGDLSAAEFPANPTAPTEPPEPTEEEAPAIAVETGEPIEIVFEDIQLPIQADMVFRPFMLTDRVRELDGRRIRIHGFMLPDSKTKGIRQFVLLKNNECKFGPGGQADHLVNVLMVDGVTAKFRDDPITVEGVLKINPFQGPDGNTWSIYDLACERVETYRPRR